MALAKRGTTAVGISHEPGIVAQSRAPEPPVGRLPHAAVVPLVRSTPADPVWTGRAVTVPPPPMSTQLFEE